MVTAKKRKKAVRRSPLDTKVASVVESSGAKARGLQRDSKLPTKTVQRVTALKRKGAGSSEIAKAARQHLEPHELQAFFTAIPDTAFWYQYFYIQFFYGCRLSEPALLMEDDVSARKKTIAIKRLKKAGEVGGYRVFTYKIDTKVARAVEIAREWKKRKGFEDNPFIFASSQHRKNSEVGKTERLSQLRNLDGWQAVSRFTAHRAFEAIARAIKLPEHLQHAQVLKHTRAIMLLANGVSKEDVQALLGHNTIKLTEKYIPLAEALKASMKSSDATIVKTWGTP